MPGDRKFMFPSSHSAAACSFIQPSIRSNLRNMFSLLPVTVLVSIAALAFISGDATIVHEPVAAAPPPSDEANSIDSSGGFSLPLVRRTSTATTTMIDVAKEEIQFIASPSSHDDGDHAAAIAAGDKKLLVPLYGRPQGSTYLVQLRIGTPADQISPRYVLFDTGSDLSWTQCEPCKNCSFTPYQPHDPSKSRTFRRLSCFDPMCEVCTVDGGGCLFRRRYGDGGAVSGELVSDVFHFGVTGDDSYQFERDVAFGCAHVEDSKAVRGYSTGVLALGFGKPSFVTQLGVDRFSYCIPASDVTGDDDRGGERSASFLRFGSHARMSGKRVPFRQDGSGFAVRLKSVVYQHGGRLNQQQPVPIFAGEEAAEVAMPMLVDSGTTLLWLPGSIFYPLQRKIEEDISLTRRYYLTHPSLYCYLGNMSDVEAVSVTLGFDGGVDLELFGTSLFFIDEEDAAEDWVCLAVAAGNRAILGVYPQRNINVGYDLSTMEIAFDRDQCDRV
uniref:Peptidase A1 domain-containing protein n=1 Tax=Oryza punctata TaxID=4537 RepID=A0A0E0KUM0_ORYPU